jgi:hypothetical protein
MLMAAAKLLVFYLVLAFVLSAARIEQEKSD